MNETQQPTTPTMDNENSGVEQPQLSQTGRRSKRHGKNQNQTPITADMAILEDTLKNTPVSVLQEILSRRGITPTYELVQIEGAIHEPTFRYRVSYTDKDSSLTAMGAGRSKKEAKHAAAKALIEKMPGQPVMVQETSIKSVNGNTEPSSNPPDDDKVMGNPIGLLQELCMAGRWPPPSYETELEVGLPHERLFTISCTVLKYREMGMGKSKKIAKRIAAQKMWQRLQETPLNQYEINQAIDEEGPEEMNQRVTNILNRYADLKDAHIPTLSNHHSFKVSQFHKTLKATYGKSLEKLQNTCLASDKVDYVKLLQEIALDHQFEVTYVDIEERTRSGRFQCLVQLSTLPVAVCQGSGKTSKDAQTNAACNALEYLKIMTKK